MIRRSLPYHLKPEDRLTRAKWARGVVIVYASALLLLALIISQRVVTEPTRGLVSVPERGALLNTDDAWNLLHLDEKAAPGASVRSPVGK
jgi:hypothetical protein